MRLPRITKLVVNDLSLFDKTIEKSFLPGINMVVGGNGIGKTTLINTILYALLGNSSYEKLNSNTGRRDSIIVVKTDYFRGRIEPKDQDSAQVCLTVRIDKNEIEVVRLLYRPSIVRIRVRLIGNENWETYEGESSDLENKYISMMEKFLAVEHFDQFVFLVANLLVFDEERRTLVWDNEIQNRIIRLLFLDREFDKRFDRLSEQVTRLDTDARHRSESRKDIKRAIGRWLETKQNTVKESDAETGVNKQQVEYQIAQLQNQAEEIDEEIINLRTSLENEVSQLKSLIAAGEHLEAEKIPLGEELGRLENSFYSGVYKVISPEYIIVLESLITKGTCQVCHTTNSQLKELGSGLKKQGKCVVCRSPVPYEELSKVANVDNTLVEDINGRRSKLNMIEIEQKSLIEAQAKTNIEIEKIQKSIAEVNNNKKHIEAKITELRAQFASEAGDKPFSDSQQDKWLSVQNQEIVKLDTEITQLYRKRDEFKDILSNLNDKLVSLLNDVNDELTPIFSEFASRFLGTACKLAVSQRTVNKKPVAFMYPVFFDKDRVQISQVSESQRFFLDQAFRMALVTWYTQRNTQPTFYIVETPEGSLDLAYEENVADMYTSFAKQGHSIIVTSNLNASNFLRGLYQQLGDVQEREERTIDLLKYGKLTSVQEMNLDSFNDRLKSLKLTPVQKG